ncbi:Spt4/RpoE2 zinc finger-domain-containing protein [Annulohypoxylon stygium]|nr:Spt4/RpoE2 zinc finger-domain-containing protein [Annulohypoxylon stygium]
MADEPTLASMHIPNNQWRYARACMVCSIIMTQSDFRNKGCPNCPFLDMKGSPEAIENCTSSQFNDVHLVVKPKVSWTAKWMRLKDFVPGIYAIKVNGSLPDEIKQTLLDDNHAIVPVLANRSRNNIVASHVRDVCNAVRKRLLPPLLSLAQARTRKLLLAHPPL